MSKACSFQAPGLRLSRAPAPGQVLLRLRAVDHETRNAAAAALGAALPTGPARPTTATGLRLYWTAPDTVLLDAGQDDGATWIARLASGLAGRHAAVHALGDARTRFVVAGAAARDVLAKGTGIDLDPRSFPVAEARLTRLAQIPVLIECTHAEPVFAILADRPLETYLWAWLVDAARSLPR